MLQGAHVCRMTFYYVPFNLYIDSQILHCYHQQSTVQIIVLLAESFFLFVLQRAALVDTS